MEIKGDKEYVLEAIDFGYMCLSYVEMAMEEWELLFEEVEGFNYYKWEFLDHLNNFSKQVARGVKNGLPEDEFMKLNMTVESIVANVEKDRKVLEARMDEKLVMNVRWDNISKARHFLLANLYIWCANRIMEQIFKGKSYELIFCENLLKEALPKFDFKTFEQNYVFTVDEYVHDVILKALKRETAKLHDNYQINIVYK